MYKEKLQAIIVNNKGKKVKTITGTTNTNGYFWNQFNKYAKNKGYTKMITGNDYTVNVAWVNDKNEILKFEWVSK
jgi:hypothetical protein